MKKLLLLFLTLFTLNISSQIRIEKAEGAWITNFNCLEVSKFIVIETISCSRGITTDIKFYNYTDDPYSKIVEKVLTREHYYITTETTYTGPGCLENVFATKYEMKEDGSLKSTIIKPQHDFVKIYYPLSNE